MKISDVKAPVTVPRVGTGEAPPAADGARDKVSVKSSREVEQAVEVAKRAAGGERSARLQRLEAEVRSGGYRANPSRVAEQILGDAEVDARIQAMLRR